MSSRSIYTINLNAKTLCEIHLCEWESYNVCWNFLGNHHKWQHFAGFTFVHLGKICKIKFSKINDAKINSRKKINCFNPFNVSVALI